MSIITGLLQNMAQNLTDEIGSGLQHTQVDSGKLANNISREMLSRTIETSINKVALDGSAKFKNY